VGHEDIITILPEEQFSVWQKIKSNMAIEENPDLKHCPTPDCPGSLSRPEELLSAAECSECSISYCFECVHKFHAPASCKMNELTLRQNGQLSNDEIQTADYLATDKSVKPCPKCKFLVCKQNGCDHIVCPSCSENFCWVCGTMGVSVSNYSHMLSPFCRGSGFEETDGPMVRVLTMPLYALLSGTISVADKFAERNAKKARIKRGERFNICVLGYSQSGKSSFIRQLTKSNQNTFETKYNGIPCTITLHEIDLSKPVDEESTKLLERTDGFVFLVNLTSKDELQNGWKPFVHYEIICLIAQEYLV